MMTHYKYINNFNLKLPNFQNSREYRKIPSKRRSTSYFECKILIYLLYVYALLYCLLYSRNTTLTCSPFIYQLGSLPCHSHLKVVVLHCYKLRRILQWHHHFSTTIKKIWRAITVAPVSASGSALRSLLHLLRFFVHPRNKLISLHILLVWAYHFTTTFPLIQPINADNSGLHYVWVIAFFDLDIFVKVFCTP